MRSRTLRTGIQLGLFIVLSGIGSPSRGSTVFEPGDKNLALPFQAKPAPKPKTPAPLTREQQVIQTTRKVVSQILAGKVDPTLLTPALRAKFTPAKVKSLGASLRAFGSLKTVTLVSRKDPREDKTTETCILRIVLGDTAFIGTLEVTKDTKVDDLQLLEE